jgi:cytochrome c553
MNLSIRFLLCSLSLWTVVVGCNQTVEIEEPKKPGDPLVRVQALAAECMVCHGTKEAQRGPILDGMETWYLTDQLEKFRSGIRGARASNRSEFLMGVGMKKIESDFELAYLADWFAEQAPVPAIRTVKGDLEKGKKFYEERCASCHGANGEGNRLVRGPSLQRLEGWYFLEQMRKFRSGERGYHPFDEGGRVMVAASKDISTGTLRDVVAYCVETFGPEEAPSNRDKYGPKPSVKPPLKPF